MPTYARRKSYPAVSRICRLRPPRRRPAALDGLAILGFNPGTSYGPRGLGKGRRH